MTTERGLCVRVTVTVTAKYFSMYCHGGHGGFEFLVQEITAILIDRDIPWEFNSIVMQTSPFFSINQ